MFTILHMSEGDLAELTALEQRCFTSDAWTEADFRSVVSGSFDTGWVYRDRALAEAARAAGKKAGVYAGPRQAEETAQGAHAEAEKPIVVEPATKAREAQGVHAEEELSDLIGYCVLRVLGDEAEVLNLCVAPSFRRAGAGDLLMDVMMQKCRDSGVQSIWLEVRAGNEAARRLYEKHGFVPQGVRKAYYQEPEEDAILMCKQGYAYELAGKGCCGG